MSSRNGFTLVELVVVILILGILAGVAAPKLFDTSAKATDNSLKTTLSIIRDAIELYAAENGGNHPTWSTSAAFHTALADYVRGTFPICPVGPNKNNTVFNGTTTTEGNGAGWRYDASSGEFAINSNDPSASDNTVLYEAF